MSPQLTRSQRVDGRASASRQSALSFGIITNYLCVCRQISKDRGGEKQAKRCLWCNSKVNRTVKICTWRKGRRGTVTLSYFMYLLFRYSTEWLYVQIQFDYSPFTRYNLLSNRLSNRFNNRLYRVYRHSTGCQTCLTTALTNGCIVYTDGCQTGFDNQLNEQWLFVQHGCQTGRQTRLTTGLTTGWMFVYTIQPVVKPVVQPVWQPVVSCKRGITVKFCLALCNR